jgi:hypothetical protein
MSVASRVLKMRLRASSPNSLLQFSNVTAVDGEHERGDGNVVVLLRRVVEEGFGQLARGVDVEEVRETVVVDVVAAGGNHRSEHGLEKRGAGSGPIS